MNKFLYVLFLSIFLLEWRLDFIPRAAKWLPEIILILPVIYILANLSRRKTIAIQAKYVIFIVLNALLILVGIVVNLVEPGIIFNGIRNFMKFLPLFILPAIYAFSDEEIKKQLKFLFVFVLLQFPVVLYQKLFLFSYSSSGDLMGGTVGNSKILSGIMLWAISIIFAYYLKEKLSMRYLVLISIILLVPVIVSETAGSLFLLPLAIIIPMQYSGNVRGNPKLLLATSVFVCLVLSALVVGYDRLYGDRWGSGGILSLVIEGKALEYEADAEKGKEGGVGIGRIAAINRAIEKLWELDPVKLFVGVGIGNASDSFNKNLQGKYYEEYREDGILKHALSMMLWNFGLIGLILFFALWLMLFLDAKALARQDNISGILSLGFLGILGMFLMQSIYINVVLNNLLGALFAYFSGLIAAQRIWLNQK